MADIACDWKDDLTLSPSGDLAMVDGSDMSEQHIVRRLLTAVRGYTWHQEYGAGLPQRIGRVAQARVIQTVVRTQILLEATVARIPIPKITVTEMVTNPGLFVVLIEYTNAVTGVAIAIQLEVPGAR